MIGSYIDQYSRKKCILFTQLFGLSFVLPFALLSLSVEKLPPWSLVLIQIGGFFYYSIQIPDLFAYTHEVFNRDSYQKLNSMMELQSQIASMLSAGLASILISRISVSGILMIDSLTYIVSFLLFFSLPDGSHQQNTTNKPKQWYSIQEGFKYLKATLLLAVFLICSFVPFVVVMIGNYLNPIHILKTLHASPQFLGISSVLYAVGAAFAGFTMPKFMKKVNLYFSVLISVMIFTLATTCVALTPYCNPFLAARLFHGWGNAAARITSRTLMMKIIPNQVMGRVYSFVDGFNLGLRRSLFSFDPYTNPAVFPLGL
jgi:predicted MFS family arabinose efflux permease